MESYTKIVFCIFIWFSLHIISHSQLTGGIGDGLVTESEAQHLIQTLKPKLAQRYPAYTFERFLKIKTQIVAGKKYYVLFRLKHTTGSLSKTEKSRKVCRAEIVRMVWLDVTDVLKLRCSKK